VRHCARSPGQHDPELKTPPHRRLIATDRPGVYHRGSRFVAVTYAHGKRIKSTHNTQREACQDRARRIARTVAPSRERSEDYAERWLAEYQGRTSRGLAPSTREGYAARSAPTRSRTSGAARRRDGGKKRVKALSAGRDMIRMLACR
jgi:hypothetical protein